MRINFTYLVVPVLLATSVLFTSKVYSVSDNAETFKDVPSEYKGFYYRGYNDGLLASRDILIGSDLEKEDYKSISYLLQCFSGKSPTQLAAIVDRYIESHPEHWHYSIHQVSFIALVNFCSGE